MRWLSVLVCVLGCGRFGFESSRTQRDADSDSTIDDDADSDGSLPTVACGLVTRIRDDFADGLIDDVRWAARYTDPGTSMSESAGLLALSTASSDAGAYAGLKSSRLYDLRGERYVVQIGTVAGTDAGSGIQLEYDIGTYVNLVHYNGTLRANYRTTTYQTVGSVAYNASEHRYWGISESAGTIQFETSMDGTTFTPFTAGIAAPFDVSQVRAAMFVGTDTAVAPVRMFTVDSVGPASPSLSPACPVNTFSDAFDDGVIGHDWSNGFIQSCCTATETGGRLVLTTNGQIGANGIRTSAGYDLRDREVTVELVTAPSVDNVTASLTVRTDDNNVLDLQIGTTTTNARRVVDGTSSSSTAARNPAERYLRIRESAGTFSMDVSTDRMTWRTLRTEATPFPFDDLMIGLRGGAGATAATGPDSVAFDNLNVP